MKYVQSDGVSMAVRERGDRHALPIVFMHGFPLDYTMWLGQAEAIKDRAWSLLPDLRGHGTTGLPEHADPASANLDQIADDVAALLDAYGIDRAVICGLSMGGYAAMAFWRRHSVRVRALVLADTKAAADTDEARANRMKQADLAMAQGSRAIAKAMLPRLVAEHNLRSSVGGAIEAMIERNTPEGIVWALHALAARPDSAGTLASVTVPTLIVAGALDAITPIADQEFMAATIPGSTLVILPQAGHMSPVESPDEFNAALIAFLDTLA